MKKIDEESKVRLKVLVVDDERLVRFTLSAILRSAGYDVVEAASPTEAMGKIRTISFNAIISDVLMGDVDGFMLRDGVRGLNKTIPIVFLTSLVNENDGLMKRVMEDFYSYYLSKNATRETILRCLAYVTNAYRIEQDATKQLERMEKGMALASLVQKAVLPKWAHVDETYHYSGYWQPYGQISGDLVEWIPISDSSCVGVFGDISGHGTHSALAMMAVQVFLKQVAPTLTDRKVRPHRLIRELNTFFAQNLQNVTYMACLVVYWNFATNEVIFHNAGYGDLKCFRISTGEQIDLNPEKRGGIPVGLLPEAYYRPEDDVHVTFPDDAMFFAYSDGITDLTEDEDGLRFIPQELIDQSLGALAQSCANELDVVEVSSEFYNMVGDLGYDKQQDDVFVCAICKSRNDPKTFVREVEPRAKDVDKAAQEASAWARETFGSDDLALRLELLLDEHLMNVVTHGLDESARRLDRIFVFVSKDKTRNLLAVRILDRGKPWDFSASAKDIDPDIRCDAQNAKLEPHGRGMAIKKRLAIDMRYRRVAGMNRNIFYLALDGSGDAARPTLEAAPADGGELS